MPVKFLWPRDQSQSVIRERFAKEQAIKIWRVIWLLLSLAGMVSLGFLFVKTLGQPEEFMNELALGQIYNLGLWLGLLATFFLARLSVTKWRKPVPLYQALGTPSDKPIDMSQYFSPATLKVLDRSFLADKVWRPWRLLQELLNRAEIKNFIRRLGTDPLVLQKRLAAIALEADLSAAQSEALFRNIAFKALEACFRNSGEVVHVSDLFEAIMLIPSKARDFLVDQEIVERAVLGVNSWQHYRRRIARQDEAARQMMLERTHHWRNRLWTSTVTPLLDSVGIDLTVVAASLPPLIGREEELKRLYEIFSGESLGTLLVGPRGSGKTRLIEGVAQRIVKAEVPPILADRRVVTMSIAKLLSLSSTKMPLKTVAAQLTREISRSGNIIIVLEDLFDFEAAKTDEAAMLVESLFTDAMKGGHVLLLASVDRQSLSKLSGPMASSMAQLEVEPLDRSMTIHVLESQVPRLETLFNVSVTYPALQVAVDLSDKFVHSQTQPGKALTLLTQATEEQTLEKRGSWVTATSVEKFLARKTGLPVTELSTQESERLLKLEEQISERYINQVKAVSAVAAAIRRARTALGSTKRPIANFLFLGPTGVGKTELSKRLADIYFGGQGKMIRLDMTEYQETQSLRNLIGAPLGTSDSGVGHLVQAVRDNPFAVILLDEFEKAHQDILNVFLQVMEDARLSAPDGEVYDFTNTMIIATSNAGSQFIQDSLRQGKNIEELTEELKRQELPKYFKPELLNRFDGIIVFEPLSYAHVVEIAKLMLQELADKLGEKEIALEVTASALKDLAEAGFDPTLGARPLRRVIQDRIEDEVAKLILGKQVRGRDKIIIDKDLALRVDQAEHY